MKKMHGNLDCLESFALDSPLSYPSINVCQGQPRSKPQALSFLFAILLMTAGSILASIEAQIFKS